MKRYYVINQSVRGESHIQRGIPKEDAAKVIRKDDRIVGAVSDGHGDPRCMRSRVGSQLAVDITLELLCDLNIEGMRDDEENLGSCITVLAHEIVNRWSRAVEEHFRENPLTEAEQKDAGNMLPEYLQGRHIPHIYGATLIALLQSEDSLLMIQKGDGHVVLIDKKSGIDDQVIPWDDRCCLNFTTSLCDSDAADTFTYRLLNGEEVESIAAVLMGSDGVEDSFANADLMGAYYGLLAVECVENGEEVTEKAMLSDLAEMSKYGSKDDISVVGLIDPETIPSMKLFFERMQKRGVLTLKLESNTSRLSSMSAAYARRERQLEEKYYKLEKLQRLRAELIEKRDEISEYVAVLRQRDLQESECYLEYIQRKIDQNAEEEKCLRIEIFEIEKDFENYGRKFDDVRCEREQLLAEIEDLK